MSDRIQCSDSCKYDIFFFFKQKTAYEMRISDWSSDVCSSDLRLDLAGPIRLAAPMSFGIKVLGVPLAAFMERHPAIEIELTLGDARHDLVAEGFDLALRIASLDDSSLLARTIELGRAPCRVRVCQYV